MKFRNTIRRLMILIAVLGVAAPQSSIIDPAPVEAFSCSQASATIYERLNFIGRQFTFCFPEGVMDFRRMAITDCDGTPQDHWNDCASSVRLRCGSICATFCMNSLPHGGGIYTLRIVHQWAGNLTGNYHNNMSSAWWCG